MTKASRVLFGLCPALLATLLHANPASAGGQIFAVVTLTNNTEQCITIPFSGAYTDNAWGTEGNTLSYASGYEVMPDGTPPRILAPGQTMYFGTKSNGGFLSASGTGGSLSIPLGQQTGHITWSNPWGYWNGLGTNATGSGWASNNGSNANPVPFGVDGGARSCGGDNTCIYSFEITGGPPASGPANTQLNPGQCMAPPTQCPSGMTCKRGIHSLSSPDGSTTLSISTSDVFGTPSAYGGDLKLVGPAGAWSNHVYDVAVVQMGFNGSLIAYDAGGNVVWSTNSSGSGALLTVGTSMMSVVQPEQICIGSGRFRHCYTSENTLWSASATSQTNQ